MIPTATYRIQLNSEFTFNDLKDIVPYLAELGISHIYASPIFKARRGSRHGYNIMDSNQINSELGGSEAFEGLLKKLIDLGLGWIQDIVPNHVAYSPETTMISDLMEFGSKSIYRDFLDVDWNYPSPKLKGKILAPFLNEDYERSLIKGQIKLSYDNGFHIKYNDIQFPVKLSSYKRILSKSEKFLYLPYQNERNLISKLQEDYISDKTIKPEIDRILERYNREYKLLHNLVSEQVYLLKNWRSAFKEINYRRFFDIIDLVCLRMEQKNAFETTHMLITQLLSDNKFDGVRVDHIDGLFDPEKYLNKLRETAPNAYIIVEKILLGKEILSKKWPIQGTTGYDFLNRLNGLFIEKQNSTEMTTVYNKCRGNKRTFNEVLRSCKKSVLRQYFAGDMKNLTRLVHRILISESFGRNFTESGLEQAIIEILSSFPVYRTYLSKHEFNKEYFEFALKTARKKNKRIRAELDAIEILLTESTSLNKALEVFMRLQQFTGAIMAKGLEDTAFYIYNRLLSLNEVGGSPREFGLSLENFHSFLSSRQKYWPFSLNATSTHDTKRGEDARTRINVLSEIPEQFYSQIKKWFLINFDKKEKLNNKPVPNFNEEYYFYQTLIGAFPLKQSEMPEFRKKMALHMTKALREAKKNSTWISPNLEYEQYMTSFVTQCLEPSKSNAFIEEFMSFQKKIALCGFQNSLSQNLIKITSPGIPDFYQGAELWDLNLVDPDNRRSVDFKKRQRYLKEIQSLKPTDLHSLLNHFADGKVKMFETEKALEIRKKKKKLFQKGMYIPLKVKGLYEHCVVAFCRKEEVNYAVTVCPRFPTKTTDMHQIALGEVWKDTFVCLPKKGMRLWTETFTERSLVSRRVGEDEGFFVQELFKIFPVALLLSGESNK